MERRRNCSLTGREERKGTFVLFPAGGQAFGVAGGSGIGGRRIFRRRGRCRVGRVAGVSGGGGGGGAGGGGDGGGGAVGGCRRFIASAHWTDENGHSGHSGLWNEARIEFSMLFFSFVLSISMETY